jgi:uncharacterized protein (UPF0332 family)
MTRSEHARQRSDRALASAQALLELGDPEGAITRAYYAVFHLARELVRQAGSTPKTHQGVGSELGRLLVSTGSVDASASQAFSQLADARLLAEYGFDDPISPARAQHFVGLAQTAAAHLRPLLLDTP